jgi:hypothetical protein
MQLVRIFFAALPLSFVESCGKEMQQAISAAALPSHLHHSSVRAAVGT